MTTPPEPARYFLVKLEAGLPISRQNGLMHAIRLHPGIEMVCDAEFAGALDLHPKLPTPKPGRRRGTPPA